MWGFCLHFLLFVILLLKKYLNDFIILATLKIGVMNVIKIVFKGSEKMIIELEDNLRLLNSLKDKVNELGESL